LHERNLQDDKIFYLYYPTMAEEQEKNTTELSGTQEPETEETIEDTKIQLAKMYLMFLDQQKWWIVATGAWLWVNLNPLQKGTIKYLTNQESDEKRNDIFKIIGKNIKKKFMEKITMQWSWPEWIHFEYDKAKLSKMKALIVANKDNQVELTKFMEQIQNGIDPTENPQPDATNDIKTNNESKQTPDVTTNDKVTPYTNEYKNVQDIPKGKDINEYLSLLTWWVVAETEARKMIEKQLVQQEFMGTKLKVNKYMAEALGKVEKDIKASNDEDLKKYVFTNMSTYNRRNAKWSESLSYHALWLAIDIDPANNPMVESKRPKIETNMPQALIDIFNTYGFVRWGNRGITDRKQWSSFRSDAMHFEFRDINYLTAAVENTTINQTA